MNTQHNKRKDSPTSNQPVIRQMRKWKPREKSGVTTSTKPDHGGPQAGPGHRHSTFPALSAAQNDAWLTPPVHVSQNSSPTSFSPQTTQGARCNSREGHLGSEPLSLSPANHRLSPSSLHFLICEMGSRVQPSRRSTSSWTQKP